LFGQEMFQKSGGNLINEIHSKKDKIFLNSI